MILLTPHANRPEDYPLSDPSRPVERLRAGERRKNQIKFAGAAANNSIGPLSASVFVSLLPNGSGSTDRLSRVEPQWIRLVTQPLLETRSSPKRVARDQ